jgi:aspartyl/asparaginyl beta-hydroxylase (cupin superfamily)
MDRSIMLLDSSVDVSSSVEELERQPDSWTVNTSRQETIRSQRDTQTILLRAVKKPLPPDTPSSEVHGSALTRIAAKFPCALNLAQQVADGIHGELSRVMIVRLKPGGKVYAHRDQGAYYQLRHRFHLMLQMHPGCGFRCAEQYLETHTGQLLWFDNKQSYEEINDSNTWSTRLIVDVLPAPHPPYGAPDYRNFALLKSGIDVDTLLADVDSQPDLWDLETGRQDRLKVQRETANIPLRGAQKPFPEGVSGNDVHPSRKSVLADRCPKIYRWLEECAQQLDGELCRATVVRLNPHGKVYRHIDVGEYYKVRDRYHLILRSPGGSEMLCGDERVIFHEGELWWFNNKAPHEAFNHSDEGRIHLIFDLLPQRLQPPQWNGLPMSARPFVSPVMPVAESD